MHCFYEGMQEETEDDHKENKAGLEQQPVVSDLVLENK